MGMQIRPCRKKSESSLDTFLKAKDEKFLHPDNEDAYQTAQSLRCAIMSKGSFLMLRLNIFFFFFFFCGEIRKIQTLPG